MVTAPHATDQQIEAFLSHLRAERGFSVNTIAAYRSDLAQLQEALSGGREDVRWERVSERDMEDVRLSLGEQGYSSTSLARKVAAVRSFFRFLLEEGVIDANPRGAHADAQAVPDAAGRADGARRPCDCCGRRRSAWGRRVCVTA